MEKDSQSKIQNIFICLINMEVGMTNTITIIIKMDNLKTHLQIKMMISKDLFYKIKLILMISMMIIMKNNMVAIIIILI